MRWMKQMKKFNIIFIIVFTISMLAPLIITSSMITVKAKTEIKLSKTKATLYVGGDSIKLSLSGTKTVKWKSGNVKIAKVSKSGVVYGLKEGSVTITATVNGKNYQCKITVKNPYITPSELKLDINEIKALTLNGINDKSIIAWLSSDEALVTVDTNGNITAKKEGTVVITATVGSNHYECSITVNPAAVTDSIAVETLPEVSANPSQPVIVDGYDITAATTGTRLRNAFSKYFTVGAAINGTSNSNSTLKSNALTSILKYHFNSTTLSNMLKPSYLLKQSESINNFKRGITTPVVSFSGVNDTLNFLKQNNIKMRGHVLIWHNQMPDWFFREGYEKNAPYVDRDTMLLRMESYMKQVLEYTQTNYPGVIYCWDVVNEAIETSAGSYETESGFHIRTKSGNGDNLWYKVIGADYVEKAFEYARKYAAPQVKLFYNDYCTFQPARTESIYKLASYLQQKGLIDGIGMQGYIDLYYPGISTGSDNIRNALMKFSRLNLEIHITELTISSKDKSDTSFQLQANRYKELFSLLKEMDTASGGPANITNVTFFGIMDEYLFYNDNTDYSRLFNKSLQPKPAFYSILSVVK